MATSNFLIWDQGKTNMQSDSVYNSDAQRVAGAPVNALFPSPLANKLYYQMTVMAWAIAAAMINKGYVMHDTDPVNLTTSLSNLLTRNDVPGFLPTFADWTHGGTSLSSGYWEKSPSGLIRQWGTGMASGDIYFPIPFTDLSSIVVVANQYWDGTGGSQYVGVSNKPSENGLDHCHITCSAGTLARTVCWQAIGR